MMIRCDGLTLMWLRWLGVPWPALIWSGWLSMPGPKNWLRFLPSTFYTVEQRQSRNPISESMTSSRVWNWGFGFDVFSCKPKKFVEEKSDRWVILCGCCRNDKVVSSDAISFNLLYSKHCIEWDADMVQISLTSRERYGGCPNRLAVLRSLPKNDYHILMSSCQEGIVMFRKPLSPDQMCSRKSPSVLLDRRP